MLFCLSPTLKAAERRRTTDRTACPAAAPDDVLLVHHLQRILLAALLVPCQHHLLRACGQQRRRIGESVRATQSSIPATPTAWRRLQLPPAGLVVVPGQPVQPSVAAGCSASGLSSTLGGGEWLGGVRTLRSTAVCQGAGAGASAANARKRHPLRMSPFGKTQTRSRLSTHMRVRAVANAAQQLKVCEG